jgi:hypothetical protein
MGWKSRYGISGFQRDCGAGSAGAGRFAGAHCQNAVLSSDDGCILVLQRATPVLTMQSLKQPSV